MMIEVTPIIRNLLTVVFVFSLPLHLQAQKRKVELLNSRTIDHSQYKDIKGNPYFYKEWKYGKMINSQSKIVDSLLVNFNGFTDNFEVRQDDEYVELETKFYPLVIVYEGDEEVYFRRNDYKQIPGSYTRVVYAGDRALVLQNYEVRTRESRAAYAGITDEGTFVGKKKYHMILDEEIHQIKLNRKNVLSRLSFTSELRAFLKKENLNLKSEKDLALVLAYYESLL